MNILCISNIQTLSLLTILSVCLLQPTVLAQLHHPIIAMVTVAVHASVFLLPHVLVGVGGESEYANITCRAQLIRGIDLLRTWCSTAPRIPRTISLQYVTCITQITAVLTNSTPQISYNHQPGPRQRKSLFPHSYSYTCTCVTVLIRLSNSQQHTCIQPQHNATVGLPVQNIRN